MSSRSKENAGNGKETAKKTKRQSANALTDAAAAANALGTLRGAAASSTKRIRRDSHPQCELCPVLKEEKRTFKNKLELAKKDAAAKNQELKSLNATIAERDEEIESLEQQQAMYDKEIAKYEKEAGKDAKKIQSLEKKLVTAEAAKQKAIYDKAIADTAKRSSTSDLANLKETNKVYKDQIAELTSDKRDSKKRTEELEKVVKALEAQLPGGELDLQRQHQREMKRLEVEKAQASADAKKVIAKARLDQSQAKKLAEKELVERKAAIKQHEQNQKLAAKEKEAERKEQDRLKRTNNIAQAISSGGGGMFGGVASGGGMFASNMGAQVCYLRCWKCHFL